jgi:mRNA-degrading endonuclease RelE of RelBE toxin-antitoxin system
VAYRIRFADSAEEQFAQLTARQQSIVLDAAKVQLRHEPLRETRNRKRLRPNPFAPWELRVGTLRVFYEVDAMEPNLINVLANRNQQRESAYYFGQGDKDMKSVKLPKELQSFLEVAETADEETLFFTKKKRPVAALVSLRKVDRESLALGTNPQFLKIIDAARKEVREGKTTSLEAVERRTRARAPNKRIERTRKMRHSPKR